MADNQPNEGELALALYQKLLSDPETRKEQLKLFKKLNPKTSIPEIDAAEPVVKEVGELRGEIDKLRKELADKDLNNQFEATANRLRAERGYTDEGWQKIVKLAADKSIPDLEVAADHFDRQNPKPEPVVDTGYRPTNYFSNADDVTDKWLKDRDGMREQEIANTMRDIRAGKI